MLLRGTGQLVRRLTKRTAVGGQSNDVNTRHLTHPPAGLLNPETEARGSQLAPQ
jgi:hypothetical protein